MRYQSGTRGGECRESSDVTMNGYGDKMLVAYCLCAMGKLCELVRPYSVNVASAGSAADPTVSCVHSQLRETFVLAVSSLRQVYMLLQAAKTTAPLILAYILDSIGPAHHRR